MKTVDNIFIELWSNRSTGEPYDKAKEKPLWMLLQRFLESKGSVTAPAEDYNVNGVKLQ